MKVILGFELNASGIFLNNAHRMYRNYSVQIGCINFVVSFFAQNLVGLYFDKVMPRQHGKRHPFCYCLKSRSDTRVQTVDPDSDGEKEEDFVEANRIFET
jgi:hypothetical protein